LCLLAWLIVAGQTEAGKMAVKSGADAPGVILRNGRCFAPRKSAPSTTLSYGYPKLLLQLEIWKGKGVIAEVNETSSILSVLAG